MSDGGDARGTWIVDLGGGSGELAQAAQDAEQQIVAGYRKLAEALGQREAHAWLRDFAKAAKPKGRGRGVADGRFNAALLVADIEAPDGQKMRARRRIAKKFGKDMSDGALIQACKRLRENGLSMDEWLILPFRQMMKYRQLVRPVPDHD